MDDPVFIEKLDPELTGIEVGNRINYWQQRFPKIDVRMKTFTEFRMGAFWSWIEIWGFPRPAVPIWRPGMLVNKVADKFFDRIGRSKFESSCGNCRLKSECGTANLESRCMSRDSPEVNIASLKYAQAIYRDMLRNDPNSLFARREFNNIDAQIRALGGRSDGTLMGRPSGDTKAFITIAMYTGHDPNHLEQEVPLSKRSGRIEPTMVDGAINAFYEDFSSTDKSAITFAVAYNADGKPIRIIDMRHDPVFGTDEVRVRIRNPFKSDRY